MAILTLMLLPTSIREASPTWTALYRRYTSPLSVLRVFFFYFCIK